MRKREVAFAVAALLLLAATWDWTPVVVVPARTHLIPVVVTDR